MKKVEIAKCISVAVVFIFGMFIAYHMFFLGFYYSEFIDVDICVDQGGVWHKKLGVCDLPIEVYERETGRIVNNK